MTSFRLILQKYITRSFHLLARQLPALVIASALFASSPAIAGEIESDVYGGLSFNFQFVFGGNPSPGFGTDIGLTFGARLSWFGIEAGIAQGDHRGTFSSEEDDGKITFLAPMSVKAFIARAGKVDLFAQVGFTPFFPSADNVYGAYSYSSGGGLQYWLNDRWTVCASLLYRYLTWDPSYDDESSSAHGLTLGIMLLYHPDMSTRGGTIFIWY